ncbi:MAG TPA: protein kinase, partial [Pirellulales bacterium]|nr:protein kinase [Pirellulales bacterium]
MVHRDLKPGNVLLGRLGEPVVTDFGLALRETGSGPGENAKKTVDFEPRLTHPGILMGTPTYMPPEQACGDLEQIGPASDIYSLGAILYELVTGRPPFRADTTAQLMRKIVSEPAPSPSGLRPGIPAKFDVICAKALAKDPAERFASMDDFADALVPCAAGGNHFRRRALAGAAAAFVLAVVAGVVFYVKTDNGTIEIRLNDPAANVEVSVDGNEVQLTDNRHVTKLRAGTHALVVEGPDFETETRVFKVIRGNNPAVEVRLTPKANAIANEGPDQERPAATIPDRGRLAALLAQGGKLIAAARYQDLEAVAEAALKIDSESPGALAMRATVRSLVHNDRAGALADVELSLKHNPETVQALVTRAAINGMTGSSDEAIADLTVAIRLDPRHPSATWMRGQAYLDKKEYRQALADSTQAIKLGHRPPDPFDVRSGALAFLGDYKNALADLDQAIEILPNPRYYVQRSALYAKLGDAEKAGADWATAVKLVPDMPDRARIILPNPPQPAERKELAPHESAAFAQALEA